MVGRRVSRSDGAGASPVIIHNHLRAGRGLWLFSDYDGTLVPIARTPGEARPDAALLEVLRCLAQTPNIRVVVLSGRPLFTLQAFLPIPGLTLAGLYGVEIQMPDGRIVRRTETEDLQRTLDHVKMAWAQLINGRAGFLLEDKGLAIALHSRFATPTDADFVQPRAHAIVEPMPRDRFRILGGERFLEIAPAMANKGETVNWLLRHTPFPDALPVYFGDDDKDEEAFIIIREHGGIPIVVGTRQPETSARARLPSPREVRERLQSFVERE